jgi:hypothetical protein
MDLTTVLEQLKRELAHLDAAILSLERLQNKTARRGRPPKAIAAMLAKPHTSPRMTLRRQSRPNPATE